MLAVSSLVCPGYGDTHAIVLVAAGGGGADGGGPGEAGAGGAAGQAGGDGAPADPSSYSAFGEEPGSSHTAGTMLGVGGGGGGGSGLVGDGATPIGSTTRKGVSPTIQITYPIPSIAVSTRSLRFKRKQQVGIASAARQIVVTNHGSRPLVVSRVLSGGRNPGDFLVNNRCIQPIPSGARCRIGIRFSPTARGADQLGSRS